MNTEKMIDISVLPEAEQDLIKALFDKCCERATQKVAEVKRKVWKPKIGEHYWYLYGDGNISTITWCGSKLDADRYKLGNCFRTEEEAEFAREKRRVKVELDRYAKEHNDEKTTDNCHVVMNTGTKEIDISSYWVLQVAGATCFSNREIANDAIEAVGKDRILKYIFGGRK